MLQSARITAFVATSDPARARAFYEGTLGLKLVEDAPFALIFDTGGTTLRIAKVQSVVVTPYTTLGWSVTDIAQTVAALSAKGVAFERYPGLEQDADGIWPSPGGAMIARFKDPDGNTLSLAEGE